MDGGAETRASGRKRKLFRAGRTFPASHADYFAYSEQFPRPIAAAQFSGDAYDRRAGGENQPMSRNGNGRRGNGATVTRVRRGFRGGSRTFAGDGTQKERTRWNRQQFRLAA